MSRHDASVVLNLIAGWDPTNYPDRGDQADAEMAVAAEIAQAVGQQLRPAMERLARLEKAVAELQRRSDGY